MPGSDRVYDGDTATAIRTGDGDDYIWITGGYDVVDAGAGTADTLKSTSMTQRPCCRPTRQRFGSVTAQVGCLAKYPTSGTSSSMAPTNFYTNTAGTNFGMISHRHGLCVSLMVPRTPYVVTEFELLQGFSDIDGDTLLVSNLVSSSGTVMDNGDGTYTDSAPNYNGAVTLNYNVVDGNGGTVAGTQGSSTL